MVQIKAGSCWLVFGEADSYFLLSRNISELILEKVVVTMKQFKVKS